MAAQPVTLSAAVEGEVDEVVLRQVVAHTGARLGAVYGKQGKAHLKKRLADYNHAARLAPWVVLLDLDQDAECAPPLRARLLPDPAPHLCLRIAVHETEAWLLADREALAEFLAISVKRIDLAPESLPDPKQALVNLAARSRQRAIWEDMAPRPGSGRVVGPAYTSRLIEFATRHWRPAIAAQHADSLARCVRRIQDLIHAHPTT